MTALWRIYGLAKKALPFYVLSIVAGAIGSAAIDLCTAILLRVSFDAMVQHDMASLLRGMTIWGAAILASALVSTVFAYIYQSKSVEITGTIRSALFAKAIKLPMSTYGRDHSGDLISRMTNDVNTIEPAYTDLAFELAGSIISGLASAVYLTSIDWRLTAYALVVGTATIVINAAWSRPLRQLGRQVQERLAALTERMSDLLAGIITIRVFNYLQTFMQLFRTQNSAAYATAMTGIRKRSALAMFQNFLFFASHFGLIGLSAFLSLKGEITLGAAIAALGVFGPIIRLMSSAMEFSTQIQGALAGADRLFELLDMAPEPKSYLLPDNATAKDEHSFIELERVSFTYGSCDSYALSDVSLKIRQGEKVALVGPSGGGKSTLLSLLLGFYPPAAGSLTIAGRPLSSLSLQELRSLIAYVPQEPYLFSGTVAENIEYGRPGASRAEIVRAAKAANAHDFIMALEAGYDTPIGEKGSRLSGGQRQRIAIARAFLRDAPIVLLDEATSALDGESESMIIDSLRRLMTDKTCIAVAHRLSAVLGFDRIIVMDKGRIVESGTHTELMEKGGLYNSLVAQQLGGIA